MVNYTKFRDRPTLIASQRMVISMPEEPREEITILLGQVAAGNKAAEEQLVGLVYERLRKMAGALMRKERSYHSLQPTALVAEMYFKLFVGMPLQTSNRAHFFGAAARAMRQVLIDHARRRNARPEGRRIPVLDDILENIKSAYQVEMLDLENALEELQRMHKRQYEVVILRFFGGLQWDEIATCLNVSTATAEKDWPPARAWLYRRLKGKENDA